MTFSLAAAALLTLVALQSEAVGSPPAGSGRARDGLELAVKARDLVPGELIRIDAIGAEPLAKVSGALRGEGLEFVRSCRAEGGCATWSAWAALDLDWDPGSLTLAVTATTASGAQQSARTTLTLGRKDFPLQELKVEKKYVDPPADAQRRIARDNKKLGAAYARRTPLPPPDAAWARPVPGEPTGVFGARRVFNGEKRKPHAGLDLRAATGTPVASSGRGIVALAEDLYFSGNTVIVDHGGGLFTIYAHLSRIDVSVGDEVDAASPVGLAGATGRVTGPHLHWGGKVGSRIFDPTALLDPAFGRGPGA